MGGGCSKSLAAEDWSSYEIMSPSVTDHYSLGKVIRTERYGSVCDARLTPAADKVLRSCQSSTKLPPQVVRRACMLDRRVAVRSTRLRSAAGKGVLEELEDQQAFMEMRIQKLQDLGDQSAELQLIHASLGTLNIEIARERKRDTSIRLREKLLREKELLEKCDHRFVVSLIECFEDSHSFYTVLEGCSGSIASRWPNGVQNIDIVARQSYQLASALHYLHGQHIIHRVVRPHNLLLERPELDSDVLLGDFSLALQLRPLDYLYDGGGAPHFSSVEGFIPYSMAFPTDVFDCGCTIYWMLLGQCPFQEASQPGTRRSTSSKASAGSCLCRCMRTSGGSMWRSRKVQVLPEDRVSFWPTGAQEDLSFLHSDGSEYTHLASIELLRRMLEKSSLERISIGDVLRDAWIAMAGPEAERPHLRGSLPSTRTGSGIFDGVLPIRGLSRGFSSESLR